MEEEILSGTIKTIKNPFTFNTLHNAKTELVCLF